MEDYQIDIMIGKCAAARSIRLNCHNLHWLGNSPEQDCYQHLKDRIWVVNHLEYYSVEELRPFCCVPQNIGG